MESIWMKPDLADDIINNKGIFDQTHSIITGKIWFSLKAW